MYSAGWEDGLRDLQQETMLRMAAACPLLRVETVDPAAQPQVLLDLAGEGQVPEGTVFVRNEAGTRTLRLEASDFLFSQRIGEEVYTVYGGEALLIGAVSRVCDPHLPKAYVLAGHGEAGLEQLGRLTWQLSAMGYDVAAGSLQTLAGAAGDVLLIIAPQSDLTEAEALALAAWVDEGGHLLVALGAEAPLARLTQLRRVLDLYGLDYRPGWAVEDPGETTYYVDRPELLTPALTADNGVMAALPGRLILPRACALARPAARPGITAAPLLTTSPRAALRADTAGDPLASGEGDVSGELLLAVLADTGAGKILQLASAQMLLDEAEAAGAQVADASENLAFIAACLEEMTGTGSGATLDAGVKQLPNQLLRFDSEKDRRQLSAALLAAWPGALLLAMAGALWRRRRL